MSTNRDARDYVVSSIEANGTAARADEFDIDAIVAEIYDRTGTFDPTELELDSVLEPEVFWGIVERHAY